MLLTPVTPKLNLELPEPKHSLPPFHLARTKMGQRKLSFLTTLLYQFKKKKKRLCYPFFLAAIDFHLFL